MGLIGLCDGLRLSISAQRDDSAGMHTNGVAGHQRVASLLANVAQSADLRLIATTDHDSIAGAQLAA